MRKIILLAAVVAFAILAPFIAFADTLTPGPAPIDWFELARVAIGVLTLILPIVFAVLKVENGKQKAADIIDAANVGMNAAYLIARKMDPKERDANAAALETTALTHARAVLSPAVADAADGEIKARIAGGLGALKAAGDLITAGGAPGK